MHDDFSASNSWVRFINSEISSSTGVGFALAKGLLPEEGFFVDNYWF